MPAKRGRKPKPPEKPQSHARPVPPDYLDTDALACWHSLCDDLERLGSIAVTDTKLIALGATVMAHHKRVDKQLKEEPLSVYHEQSGLLKINPLCAQLTTASATFTRLLKELKLTPSTRGKGISQTDNPLDDFLNNK